MRNGNIDGNQLLLLDLNETKVYQYEIVERERKSEKQVSGYDGSVFRSK
ncbi:MAG TPA: hypothetical protein VFG01_05655 [Acidobacteriota bacterium]|nr:hypothetical protein [Acidobacteriota bacterium]